MPTTASGGQARTRAARVLPALIAIGVFIVAFLFRLGTFSFSNDDYLHLTIAQQLLLGDVPVRDFIDPGEFLFNYVSAAVQLLLGRTTVSEVMLDLALLSLGYALVYLLAFRATRSQVIALLVTAIAILLVPRLYSYPKIFLYAVALAMLWHYADDRRDRHLFWIALWTAMAFLFRHDHGAIIGAAMCVMLVLTHWNQGWRRALGKVLLFGGCTVVLLLPFFVFLQVNQGVVSYLRNTMETGRAEYRRTVGDFPAFRFARGGFFPTLKMAMPRIAVRWAEDVDDDTRQALEKHFHLTAPVDQQDQGWQYDLRDRSTQNLAAIVGDPRVLRTDGFDPKMLEITAQVVEPNVLAWFYYLTIVIPPVTLLVIALGLRAGAVPRIDNEVPKIVTAAFLAGLMHLFLLRARSESAVADVSVLTAVLGAWLLMRSLRGTGAWRLATAAVALSILGVTLVAASKGDGGYLLGRLSPALQRYGTDAIFDNLTRFARPRARFDIEAVRYVFACTDDRDRLLVTGYVPQIYYESGRGFAAGRPYFLTSFAPSRASEQFSLERLRTERVPIVLATRSFEGEFLASYPLLREYLGEHYREVGQVDGGDFRVLTDARIPPVGTYGSGSLPCFRHDAEHPAQ